MIHAVGELKWMGPVVVNVKCDLPPGRVHHFVFKVRWCVVLCSAVGSAGCVTPL